MQARLTGKVPLTSVLINETSLLQVLMVGVLCTQHKLAVNVLVKLSVHGAL